MRFIYSPYFGSKPYVDLRGRSSIMLKEAPIGTAELLQQLELRTGNVPGPASSDLDRLVSYVRALRHALTEAPGLFFGPSFKNDEIGTAKVLLSWRDALKMALWKPDVAPTEKLRGLARIERHFSDSGYADRWVALLDYLVREDAIIPEGMEIKYRVSLDSVEPCVRRVLETLKKKGMSVTEDFVKKGAAPVGTALRTVQDVLLSDDKEKREVKDDGTFRQVAFRFGGDATRWAALHSEKWAKDGSLIVNDKVSPMNGALRSLGRPLLRNDVEGSPQSAQLFLLGIALFRNPVDAQRVLSYLRAPVNPIGELFLMKEKAKGGTYYKSLARELIDMLLRNGGLNDWDKTIAAAIYDREGKEMEEQKRNTILGRFLMWENTDEDGSVPTGALRSWLKNMDEWGQAKSKDHPDDAGFKSLSTYCGAMSALLADAPDVIPFERAVRWAEGIFTVQKTMVDVAGTHSPDCVPDLRDILDGPSEVIWMGASGDETGYPYSFLSSEEQKVVGAPSPETYSRSGYDALVQALCRIKGKFIILTYACEAGTVLPIHPLLTELRARLIYTVEDGEELPVAVGSVDKLPVPAPRMPKEEYHVDSKLFDGLSEPSAKNGLRPDHESATSLDKLIQHPFDYVLEDILGFEGYGEEQISDPAIIRGNVAHQYVKDLVDACGGNLKEMERLLSKEFLQRITDTAQRRGASLLSPENALEWRKLCEFLRQSVIRLLDLIRDNKLSIVASEKRFETELPVIGPFVGSIDLLLKDKDDKLVIFDFKWNESSKYNRIMERREILQLVLYKEAAQISLGKEVSAYGYWLFPKQKFYTECPSIKGPNVMCFGDDGDVAPDTDKLFEMICNAYSFRMDQISRGIVEEGEMMELAGLEYWRKQDDEKKPMYPLKSAYNQDNLKGRPYGNPNITLKGGLE